MRDIFRGGEVTVRGMHPYFIRERRLKWLQTGGYQYRHIRTTYGREREKSRECFRKAEAHLKADNCLYEYRHIHSDIYRQPLVFRLLLSWRFKTYVYSTCCALWNFKCTWTINTEWKKGFEGNQLNNKLKAN